MIDIGQKNKIIIGKGGEFILHSLVDFYETLGKNVLYIIGDKNYPLKCNTIKVGRYEWEKTEEKIMSNLFRLDYIIVRSNFYSDKIVELIDKKINIPSFYVFESTSPISQKSNNSKYDYIYYFHCDDSYNQLRSRLSNPLSPSLSDIFNEESHIIKDVKNNWSDSLSNIKIRWIRDKKLENLFGHS